MYLVLQASLLASQHLVHGACCRLGFSPDSVKASAHKKLLGDQEAEGAKKKVTVCDPVILRSVACSQDACATCLCYHPTLLNALQTVSSKSSSKSLQDFCRDLCEAAAKNSIDPVSVLSAACTSSCSLVWHTKYPFGIAMCEVCVG